MSIERAADKNTNKKEKTHEQKACLFECMSFPTFPVAQRATDIRKRPPFLNMRPFRRVRLPFPTCPVTLWGTDFQKLHLFEYMLCPSCPVALWGTDFQKQSLLTF